MELLSLRTFLGRICLLFSVYAISAEKAPQNQQPTLPTRLEVDLIFPRNDTYAPIYAFPVVFAIRGAAPLINPRTTESLVKVNWYLSAEKAMVSLGNLDFEQQSVVKAGLEPYYMIQAANTLVNSTGASWTLEWTVQLASNCSGQLDYQGDKQIPSKTSQYRSGKVLLTLDSKGKLPDIVPDNDSICPQALATVDISGRNRVANADDCLVQYDKTELGDPCAVKPTSKLEKDVAARMQTQICTKQTWPDKSIVGNCPPGFYSGSNPTLARHFGAELVAVLVAWACWTVLN